MSAQIILSDEHAAELHRLMANGTSSRRAAEWYRKTTSRPISHTTLLKLVREMREEAALDAMIAALPEDASLRSDWEQLALAIAERRRLQRLLSEPTGRSENLAIALKAVILEITGLKLMIFLGAQEAARRDQLSGKARLEKIFFPPSKPEIVQESSEKTGNSDPSSGPSRTLPATLPGLLQPRRGT